MLVTMILIPPERSNYAIEGLYLHLYNKAVAMTALLEFINVTSPMLASHFLNINLYGI